MLSKRTCKSDSTRSQRKKFTLIHSRGWNFTHSVIRCRNCRSCPLSVSIRNFMEKVTLAFEDLVRLTMLEPAKNPFEKIVNFRALADLMVVLKRSTLSTIHPPLEGSSLATLIEGSAKQILLPISKGLPPKIKRMPWTNRIEK